MAESVNGTWIDYVWLNGRLIGRASGSAVYAVHDDQTGRPQAVTDASGAVAWKASNYPFDRAVTVDNIGGLNVGFPGQYYDAERGTWNNGYRDYNASLGRYIEGDPIGLMGGINAYVYVGGGPLKHVDPFGLTKWTVGMFSIGANFGYVRFQAISECVDGKQTVAEGNVGFFSLGAGLGFSGSTVTVDDGMPGNLDSSVFNGLYVAQGGNITLGFGVGYSGVRFGRAATDGHSWARRAV
jgi:RHS repeat-associated protein